MWNNDDNDDDDDNDDNYDDDDDGADDADDCENDNEFGNDDKLLFEKSTLHKLSCRKHRVAIPAATGETPRNNGWY